MFKTLETFDTKLSADSVEWCPADHFEDIFACGTYQLASEDGEGINSKNELETKKRIGRIYLFQVIRDEKLKLKLLEQLEVPAVLDMKWAHIKCFNSKILLGVVNSNGFLQIYELVKEIEKISLKFLSQILVNDKEGPVLALSLDWSTGRKDQDKNVDVKISVSDSQGSISLFKIHQSGNNIEKLISWHAHNFEAWITAFDYWHTNTVYSGGDDCMLLCFDVRMDAAVLKNTNRSHNAGVTSLHSNWKKEFCLISGSYDETLRIWDSRNFRRPLSEVNLGGGIWRVKWDPHECKYLLTACMYNGFSVLNCADLGSPEVIAEYKEHGSIAYGCDWSHLDKQLYIKEKLLKDDLKLVGTCSFYDHILKLSTVNLIK